jgi:hypothetical protein
MTDLHATLGAGDYRTCARTTCAGWRLMSQRNCPNPLPRRAVTKLKVKNAKFKIWFLTFNF